MKARDLRKEPPRSAHFRIRDYVILARAIDKCRADIQGIAGGYHFNCPLDQKLFEFKGIDAAQFRDFVKTGASDEEIGHWMDEHGNVQTPGSISEWSARMDNYHPYADEDKRQWFIEQCKPLGIDPRKTTLFGYLEADDKASFPDALQVSPDRHNWDLPMVETAPRPRDPSIRGAVH